MKWGCWDGCVGYPEAMLPGEAIPKRVGLHWQEQGSDDQSINQSKWQEQDWSGVGMLEVDHLKAHNKGLYWG